MLHENGGADGVLPRFHGRLGQESIGLIAGIEPALDERIVEALDVVEHVAPGFRLGACGPTPSADGEESSTVVCLAGR